MRSYLIKPFGKRIGKTSQKLCCNSWSMPPFDQFVFIIFILLKKNKNFESIMKPIQIETCDNAPLTVIYYISMKLITTSQQSILQALQVRATSIRYLIDLVFSDIFGWVC